MTLAPLPTDDEVVAAVRQLQDAGRYRWVTATEVASACGVDGARRFGRGAVKGSWSGYMAGALRIAPRLRKLAREGRLVSMYGERSIHTYRTEA